MYDRTYRMTPDFRRRAETKGSWHMKRGGASHSGGLSSVVESYVCFQGPDDTFEEGKTYLSFHSLSFGSLCPTVPTIRVNTLFPMT